ncbi:hypothetical protein [Roseivirga pacifica]|uniref:hypothetical protein n=1 Tax=Roseivirga pacifica TaxID=1267423 RepID=UPI003BAE6316
MKRGNQGMSTPSNRKEFEHNVFLVIEDAHSVIETNDEELIQNKLRATGRHLARVESLPNGRLNINTVNEMLRLQANTLEWMKNMPLPEIVEKGKFQKP